MKVIKDGRKRYYCICDKCNSILEYDETDVYNLGGKHIECEVCRNPIMLYNDNNVLFSENGINEEEIKKYVTQ